MLTTNGLHDACIKVIVQRLTDSLVDEKGAQMLHLSRNILLAEEGAQNAFLFKRGFSGPVALQELFDVLVIHTFLIVLYISDVCKTEKLQENEKNLIFSLSYLLTLSPSQFSDIFL